MGVVLEFSGPETPLNAGDIPAVAAALKPPLQPAVVAAVYDVETGGAAFLPDKRPNILFESHAFHLHTGGKWDHSHPGISTPSWVHNYGAGGAHQYERLHEAIALDRAAALSSASWGAFQIMGSNFAACGYADVEKFVAAMCVGVRQHLDAFAGFVTHNGLVAALARKDWPAFARGYNGPGQVALYAGRMSAAFNRECQHYAHNLAAAVERLAA